MEINYKQFSSLKSLKGTFQEGGGSQGTFEQVLLHKEGITN